MSKNAEPRTAVTPAQLAFGLSLIAFTVALGQNVGLSLVLERSGAEALPPLTVVNGVLLGATTATVSFLGRGLAARSLGICMTLAAALVGLAVLGGRAAPAASAATLYLVANVLGDLSAALFWSLANELYDPRAAKQVFPRVGAAGTAGAALAGLVARALGDVLGERGLVVWWVISLVAAAAWALRLARGGGTELLPARLAREPSRSRRNADAKRSGAGARPSRPEDVALVRALALGLIVVIAVTTVGRYLYSASLAKTYGADAVAIAKLNGTLNTIASVATALVQLLVTPLLLGRFGIRAAMFVYPVSLVIVLVVLGIAPTLGVAVAVFFVTSVIRRGIQGPVESVLPTGLVPAAASRAVLLLTAIGAPVGMLLGGACSMLGGVGRGGSTNAVAMVGVALSVFLVAVAAWRARAYRSALRVRLAKGGSDLRQLLLGATVATRDVDALVVEELDAADPELVARLRTLARARARRDDARVAATHWDPTSPLATIAVSRIADAYRLHAALARLPASTRTQAARELLVGAIEHRIADDVLAVIFAVQASTGNADLDRVSRRVFDRDVRARSAAVEILDAASPADLRGFLVPLVERVGLDGARAKAARRFGAPSTDPVDDLLDVPDPWIRACTIYALDAEGVMRHRTRIEALADAPDRFVAAAVEDALARG